MMRSFPKAGLLLIVGLLTTAALATSAQAQTFNPDNTAVSGVSSNFSLSYGVAVVTCDTATMDGTTGLDSGSLPVALGFFGSCTAEGLGPATMDCRGDLILIAEDATNDTGSIELPSGFECSATTAVCTVTIAGPQLSAPGSWVLDEANDVLSLNADFQASLTGSVACGPASGTGNISADYNMSPSNLTIDP